MAKPNNLREDTIGSRAEARPSSGALHQYGSKVSRSSFGQEAAVPTNVNKLALRSAGSIGTLWRGLDGVWRDPADRPINITQKTQSGKFFNLLEPDPNTICPSDLALGLSRECRWNGQTRGDFGYSVAQHSVAMLKLLQKELARPNDFLLRYALLHDAEEGLGVKDTITGLKIVLGETYLEIANSISEAIHIRFSLPYPVPQKIQRKIKQADAVLGMTEAIHLMGFTSDEYRLRVKSPKLQPVEDVEFIEDYITPWSPMVARDRFLAELEEI